MHEQMGSIISRLIWFSILATVIAYASYLAVGSIVNAQAGGASDPVVIRDELRANQHSLSGMVVVPTPCDELSVQTQALSQTNFAIVFTTWHEPSVNCGNAPTPRAFETILFAPAAGITFTATLDNKDLQVAVIPVIVRTH